MERAERVAAVIRQEVPLDTSVRMLEYGAGTGLVTQALRTRVGPVTLVDTSDGMRRVIRDKIAAGILPDARVWDVDLGEEPAPEERFDLIVTVMTLHHIRNLPVVLSNFASLLYEDGYLCIVDLEEEDGSFHDRDFNGHNGFDRSFLVARLAEAGFRNVSFRPCYEVVRETRTYPLFLATCMRRPTGPEGPG